jgi:hypothetical protein
MHVNMIYMHFVLHCKDNCLYLLIIRNLIGFARVGIIRMCISLIVLLFEVNTLDILAIAIRGRVVLFLLHWLLYKFFQLYEYTL